MNRLSLLPTETLACVPQEAERVTLKALLTFSATDSHEWGLIRARQLLAGRHRIWLMLGAAVLTVTLCGALLYHSMPLWEILLWMVMTVATAAAGAVRMALTPARAFSHASRTDIRQTAWNGLALGLVLSVLPILLCMQGKPIRALGPGIALMLFSTATAFFMAPLALATTAFLLAFGLVTASCLVLTGAPVAGVATLIFTILLLTICMSRAKALAIIETAGLALDERDETVSLLLREFEATGAHWLWEIDGGRRIVRANRQLAVACEQDAALLDGMPFLQVLAGPTWDTGHFAPGLRTLAKKLKARESFSAVRLPVWIAGEERWWEVSASPRFDNRGTFCGFRGVGSDVTDQRASADKINRMARYDALTGLPNRLMINETLSLAITETDPAIGRYAFMMLDLDRFKAVNDTLGHPIGDRLLCGVAARLDALMGANETCGRLGGDEFAVIIPDATDVAGVETLAQRIIEALSRPYEIDHHTLYIGASVGIAVGPRDGRTSEMLVRSADLALYRAKDAGRGVYRTYEPELHAQAEERRILEIALRSAIERDEMHLEYQPIVDTDTTMLRGFEALLRWRSADLGDVSPAKFIPIAQETRLIAPIGDWVLRTACREAARWPANVRVAVNVSPEQLYNPGFVAMVTAALANADLAPERLELEVTEGLFLHKGHGVGIVLDRILKLGVRLSLDDFGTGQSSLGYLSRTRFSSIKIDRSFVEAASHGGREALAIIRAVVALAHSLGIATTAEGVETEAERRIVEALGCTRAQGYLFGRPLPVEEARALANELVTTIIAA